MRVRDMLSTCKTIPHVETVVFLSQRKADDYVEVELELDELDLTRAESKKIESLNRQRNSIMDWKYESIDTVMHLSLHDCECSRIYNENNNLVMLMEWCDCLIISNHPFICCFI